MLTHTPRLCIDGRAALEFSTQGLLAQELIDQLVAATGEPEASSDWIEQKRTVLLAHPDQIFAGQLKRFDTKKRIGSSFFYWAWEKHFVENASISAFHRFRPADRLEPILDCPAITTVLPSLRSLQNSKLPTSDKHRFVVPSETDRERLIEAYHLSEEHVLVAFPSARRFVHFTDRQLGPCDGQVLFLVENNKKFDLHKLENILSSQYPHVPQRVVLLDAARNFSPKNWAEILRFTTICFYLTERAFDWPFLALEALYFEVPLIFLDNHASLSSQLPRSPLSLSRYLTHFLNASQLRDTVSDARARLQAIGAFDPHALAKKYKQIYSGIQA